MSSIFTCICGSIYNAMMGMVKETNSIEALVLLQVERVKDPKMNNHELLANSTVINNPYFLYAC